MKLRIYDSKIDSLIDVTSFWNEIPNSCFENADNLKNFLIKVLKDNEHTTFNGHEVARLIITDTIHNWECSNKDFQKYYDKVSSLVNYFYNHLYIQLSII